PVISADKIPPGIAHRRELQPTQRIEHILPAPRVIRVRSLGLIHALIHRAAQMLEKPAEDARVNRVDHKRRVQMKRVFHAAGMSQEGLASETSRENSEPMHAHRSHCVVPARAATANPPAAPRASPSLCTQSPPPRCRPEASQFLLIL